jgi:hypothetical protein
MKKWKFQCIFYINPGGCSMRKVLLNIMIVFLALGLSNCDDKGTVKQGGAPKLVKASSETMPDWVLKKKKSDEYVYFVGMSSKAPDMKEAKKTSVDDAVSQLVEYIGFKATAQFQSKKEISDLDNISSFKQNIMQTLDGKGTAKVNIDVEEIYFEQYSDNTYSIYSLIKFPVDWVQKERTRLQKLTADQREKSESYLKEADASVVKGDMMKALDLALNALYISEKAAENSDLYDQSKNMIALVLSSLTFSIEGTPRFAYLEGGSDPVNIKASSSKSGSPVAGMMMEYYEVNTNAQVSSKTGNITDGSGIVKISADKLKDPAPDQVTVFVSFSMAKFKPVNDIDEEFYQKIKDLQVSQAVKVNLKSAKMDKVIPTSLFVIDLITDQKKNVKTALSPAFLEQVSGKMADAGYNIISIDIPKQVLLQGKADGQIRESVMSYIKKNYNGIKRVLLGVRDINILGKLGEDVKFDIYKLNDSGIIIVDMKFVLSLMDVDSGKVEKGITIGAKGQGLNDEQAIQTGERKMLEKMQDQIGDFGN